MSQKIRYQVTFIEKFVVNGEEYELKDAIYYDSLPSQKQIDKDKKSRVDGRISFLKNPPVRVPPTIEQLQQELQEIKSSEQVVTDRKKEILISLGISELEALQSEMRNIEEKFNAVKEKVDSLSPSVLPLEAVADILDKQTKDVDERISKKIVEGK